MNNYKNTVSQVVDILGDENSAADYLSKCIYSIGVGSNDYLNNYFMPLYYSTANQYSPDQYADALIQQYSQQIRVHTDTDSHVVVVVVVVGAYLTTFFVVGYRLCTIMEQGSFL